MKQKSCIVINNEEDIVQARKVGRELAGDIGFDELTQSQIVTVISELAQNMCAYATSGIVCLSLIEEAERKGLHIQAKDNGPGIDDVQQVMDVGYSLNGNMGAGLPGIQKMVDDFKINTEQGKGTEVLVIKWLDA